MNSVILSLGSNMGDRLVNLAGARELLEELSCRILHASSVYETAPWGHADQPAFYNQVLQAKTHLDASTLMDSILGIEKKMGRIRNQKWEPRVIDIDILFFNDQIINTVNLSIPHPHLHKRRFILAPLNEILPGLNHPVLHRTISELLSSLTDDCAVEKLKTVPHT